jgi:transcriptional regulator with XRE-family HTH domain
MRWGWRDGHQKSSKMSILTTVRIGRSVREQRVKRFMTQEQLARMADISLRQVVRIERNEVEPRFSTILKLAEAFGVEPSELVDRE